MTTEQRLAVYHQQNGARRLVLTPAQRRRAHKKVRRAMKWEAAKQAGDTGTLNTSTHLHFERSGDE